MDINGIMTPALYYLGLFISIILFASLAFGTAYLKSRKRKIEESSRILLEKKQYEAMLSANQKVSMILHDQKNQLLVIRSLAQNADTEKLMSYIDQLEQDLSGISAAIPTGGHVIEYLVADKAEIMKRKGINFTPFLILPKILPIADYQMTALLGNILDNAIEACDILLKDNKSAYIRLEIKPLSGFITIFLENSARNNYVYSSSGQLRSTKNLKGHGLGLKRVQQIAEEAEGMMRIEQGNDTFTVKILLPIRKQEEKCFEFQ